MSEFSVLPIRPYSHLGFYKAIVSYIPEGGNGYFASTFPDHIVSVEGVPAIGEVRVLLRTAPVPQGDGLLVATTKTNASGEWRVEGLNPNYRYDVVCRFEGYNDLIFSNIKPKV